MQALYYVVVYRAIVFDFFDVIHDDPFKLWLSSSGINRTQEYDSISDAVDLGTISETEFYQKLSKVSRQKYLSVKTFFDNVNSLNYEIIEVIRKLHKNYKIGLLSNSSSEYVRPIIEKHDLKDLFDAIVVSAEIKTIKPSKDAFLHILELLGASPLESVFIDDNRRNVLAARKLGMKAFVYVDNKSFEKFLDEQDIAMP